MRDNRPTTERPRPQPKTLVVGSSGHSYVRCIPWADLTSVNLKDFDVVVVNVSSLDDRTIIRLPQYGFFDKVRAQFSLLLASSGKIIALTPELRTITQKDDQRTNWEWCPLDIGTQHEVGDTIEIKSKNFERYLSKMKQWSFYFFVPQNALTRELTSVFGSPYNVGYALPFEPFAVNRYGKTLAGEMLLGISSDGHNNLFGGITLLPFIEELEQKEAMNLILEELIGKPQQSVPPDWVTQIPMPFVDAISTDISNKLEAIGSLQEEIAADEKKRSEIEKWKKLVYATGRELEQVVEEAFVRLGAKTRPPVAEEEFIFEHNTIVAVVECKGIGKSISLDHMRQTDSHVLSFSEAENCEGKGVLFGNAWRHLPLAERGKNDTPIFPDNVVKHATQRQIALVSAVDFFHAFCQFLSGDVSGDAILDALSTQNGVVDFRRVK